MFITFFPILYFFSWFLLVSLISVLFLIVFLYHILVSSNLLLSIDFIVMGGISFSVSILSDFYTSLFSFIVCFITLVVFCFTIYYFSSFINLSYFMWITFLFVCSILILINFSDLLILMLGWDGLGVVSFFLILYYSSPVSVFSSIFTILINRLGDCLFVLSICFWSVSNYSTCLLVIDFSESLALIATLVATFMTNSALFPFSPWLPIAIAAPTPISSLVHSSTLVTAGLFLIIRNYSFIAESLSVLNFLVVLGAFTSFYAGSSSLIEPDLKKVVALSTLSHLGFICFSLGLGWVSLAFFHLAIHALFNSSLFMAIGGLIVQNYHFQDSRYFSSLSNSSPFLVAVVVVSISNLLGVPFCSGFFSNDLVLESFSYSLVGWFLCLLIYFNLIFTYSYSARILFSVVSSSYSGPYNLYLNGFSFYSLFLFTLSSLSLVAGVLLTKSLIHTSFSVPFTFKILPLCLTIAVLLAFSFYISKSFRNSYSFLGLFTSYFYSMFYLTPLLSSVFPLNLLTWASKVNRMLELGGLYYLVVTSWQNLGYSAVLGATYLYHLNFRVAMSYVIFTVVLLIVTLLL